MRDHYDFDYSKSRPNRFAERLAAIDDDDLRPEYPPEFFRDMKPNRFAGGGTPPSQPARRRRS